MLKSRHYERKLEDIIDSDDELSTDCYIETPYAPAYLDDTRFEYLEDLRRKNQELTCEAKREIVIQDFMLNKRDHFCFQCIKDLPVDTLSWFFEFLVHKELQSTYQFLRPCLVLQYKKYYSRIASDSISLSRWKQKINNK